jgi:hypothetical protein
MRLALSMLLTAPPTGVSWWLTSMNPALFPPYMRLLGSAAVALIVFAFAWFVIFSGQRSPNVWALIISALLSLPLTCIWVFIMAGFAVSLPDGAIPTGLMVPAAALALSLPLLGCVTIGSRIGSGRGSGED